VRRRDSGPRERPLSSPERRLPIVIEELRGATQHHQFDFRFSPGPRDRDPVFARFPDLDPARRCVDPIGHLTASARNRESNPPFQQADDLVGLDVDDGGAVDVESGAVGEEYFQTTVRGAEAIARHKGHRERRRVGPAIALE
jgi:hypothetical protein